MSSIQSHSHSIIIIRRHSVGRSDLAGGSTRKKGQIDRCIEEVSTVGIEVTVDIDYELKSGDITISFRDVSRVGDGANVCWNMIGPPILRLTSNNQITLRIRRMLFSDFTIFRNPYTHTEGDNYPLLRSQNLSK